jgi:hypothetical protein
MGNAKILKNHAKAYSGILIALLKRPQKLEHVNTKHLSVGADGKSRSSMLTMNF